MLFRSGRFFQLLERMLHSLTPASTERGVGMPDRPPYGMGPYGPFPGAYGYPPQLPYYPPPYGMGSQYPGSARGTVPDMGQYPQQFMRQHPSAYPAPPTMPAYPERSRYPYSPSMTPASMPSGQGPYAQYGPSGGGEAGPSSHSRGAFAASDGKNVSR